MLLTRNPLYKETSGLEVKGWKKVFHANTSHKKARVAILKSDKIDSRTKNIMSDKDDDFITIKYIMILCLHQEDITHLNVYAPNNEASNYTKQNLIEGLAWWRSG